MSASRRALPGWIEIGVIPMTNVAIAFLIAGLVVLAIGANPLEAVRIMKVAALSIITNSAAGMSDEKLSHAHTLENAKRAADTVRRLLNEFVRGLT